MTSRAISQLDELSYSTDDDLLVTVNETTTYKITKANFLQSSNNEIADETSFAFGKVNLAGGEFATAVGQGNQSFYGSAAFGGENIAYAPVCVAFGRQNTASYPVATAMGIQNTASDYLAVAIGYDNTASGAESTAMGVINTVSANQSTAIGYNNNVTAYACAVIGLHNTCGGDYTVMAGYRNTCYDEDCVVIGGNNFAYNDDSILIGRGNISYDDDSIAIGRNNICTNDNAIAIGDGNSASGWYSVCAGYSNTASGSYGISIGGENTASDSNAIAFGYSCLAGGEQSISIGTYSQVYADYSISIGTSCVSYEDNSTAIGYECRTSAVKSTGLGYRAHTNVDNTVNIGGMIIVAKAAGFSSEYEPYAGAETILMGQEMDLTNPAESVLFGDYKIIPQGSTFFCNETGLIITEANTLSYEPEIEFGTESGVTVNVQRVQGVTAAGTGTSIELTWGGTTVNGNTLIGICAVDANIGITCSMGEDSAELIAVQAFGDLEIAMFLIPNAAPHSGAVTFGFDTSVNARGFIYEYSGLPEEPFDGYTGSSGTGTNPAAGTYSSSVSIFEPGSLWLGVIANAQTDPFDSPSNSFTIAHQGDFGTNNVGVFERIVVSAGNAVTTIASNSADFAGVMTVFHANMAGADDLVDGPTVSSSALFKRHRFVDLQNYDGHTFLWAGITTPAVVGEDGHLKGRFYWKGILVENQT